MNGLPCRNFLIYNNKARRTFRESRLQLAILCLIMYINNSKYVVSAFTTSTRRSLSSIPGYIFSGSAPSMKKYESRLFLSESTSSDGTTTSMSDSNNNDASKSLSNFERKNEELKASSRLSLAPMMEYTDRHFRHLFRLISDNTLLYTEMVAANAIAHEYRQQKTFAEAGDESEEYDDWQMRRYLSQSPLERSSGGSVLQLGGSDPAQLYTSAKALIKMTHDENECDYTAVNLNCGCPSPKVAGKGCFGAALMDDPVLVKECCTALFEGTDKSIPITVKCRIGTDLNWRNDNDSTNIMNMKDYKTREDKSFEEKEYQQLCEFIDTISSGNVVTDFQIHARIAVLKTKSFSPADNRKIPPLKYDYVHRLTKDFPHLTFSLNGGIETLNQAKEQLDICPELQGIMIGRGMAANPWGFAMTDSVLYGDDTNSFSSLPRQNRWELLKAYGENADREELIWGTKIRRFILKAVQALFMGEPNAKKFRIELDRVGGLPKEFVKKGLAPDSDSTPLSEYILNAATEHLKEEVLMRSPLESYERMVEMEEKERMRKEGTDSTVFLMKNVAGADSKSTEIKASNGSNKDDGKDMKSMIAEEWKSMREADLESLRVAKEEGDENLMDYAQMLEGLNADAKNSTSNVSK